ncbi:hypothetical protein [Photobacterium kishitanii]|uniref:Uncharacterized protein n=1 Tax=Photobacterium kishitanii TaxID=318456 RepID=A0A2T3KMS4_9GAMM|nr:hypothetical protein [Photobacterium kishitanii]PSV01091.1 hypothetical protein C9J27_03470 [Photobacterium kishitanii]
MAETTKLSDYPQDYKDIFKDVLTTNIITFGVESHDDIEILSFLIDICAAFVVRAIREINSTEPQLAFTSLYDDLEYANFLESECMFRYSNYSERFKEYLKLSVYPLYLAFPDYCKSNATLVETLCDDLVFGIYSMSMERRRNTLKDRE